MGSLQDSIAIRCDGLNAKLDPKVNSIREAINPIIKMQQLSALKKSLEVQNFCHPALKAARDDRVVKSFSIMHRQITMA